MKVWLALETNVSPSLLKELKEAVKHGEPMVIRVASPVTVMEVSEISEKPVPKTTEEKIAFRKEWDARVARGKA